MTKRCIVHKHSKEFEEHCLDVQTKENRNFAILNAYKMEIYSLGVISKNN